MFKAAYGMCKGPVARWEVRGIQETEAFGLEGQGGAGGLARLC